MPSTIIGLLASVGLEPAGCVPWRTLVPEASAGVYVVSLSNSAAEIAGIHPEAPLSGAALGGLSAVCPTLTLDGRPNPTRRQLAARIGSYWLPDECVLYIGLAGQPLRKRVGQYYKTPLGAAKPHAGGWWLKTLAVLDELFVHYAPTPDFKTAEEDMLHEFAEAVSDASATRLAAGEPVMPFANLRDGDWRRRRHRIGNATGGGVSTAHQTKRSTSSARIALSVPRVARPGQKMMPHHRSQTLTAKDIEMGQVRIPRGATKTILPSDRREIAVVIRGRELTCRWHPRYGPPERSGVVRIGRAPARELLQEGDVLAVTLASSGVVGLD